MKKSHLYVVATPIGNLSDMTFRAVETLKSVDFIIAEDTRHIQILLKKYDIEADVTSFHAKSSPAKAQQICHQIAQGKTAALVSDAGTPCISDPGYTLLREAITHDITITPVPGPSAFLTLLSVSGAPANRFSFHGFIPHKKGRKTFLEQFIENESSQLFYESVHRFPRLLNELTEILDPTRSIVVGRELTKLYEDIFRGTISEAKDYFSPENTKGEFVILIPPHNFSYPNTP